MKKTEKTTKPISKLSGKPLVKYSRGGTLDGRHYVETANGEWRRIDPATGKLFPKAGK